MGVCNCSMFCCTLLYVPYSFAIILMGKRELVALLSLSSWCLVMVERLFLAVPQGCLQLVIVVFPDHTHLPYLAIGSYIYRLNRTSSHRYAIRVSIKIVSEYDQEIDCCVALPRLAIGLSAVCDCGIS